MFWNNGPSRFEKVTSFTVPADREQVERWQAAAQVQGQGSVSTWLAETADAYLREVTKAGNPLPLKWYGYRFRVLIEPNGVKEPYEIGVRGRESGPFGVFRGSRQGPENGPGASFSLVHLPTRRIIATLSRQKDCMMLAAELIPLRVNWEESDPEKVVLGTPDEKRVREIIQLYRKG
jgi:hypothetical protein